MSFINLHESSSRCASVFRVNAECADFNSVDNLILCSLFLISAYPGSHGKYLHVISHSCLLVVLKIDRLLDVQITSVQRDLRCFHYQV